MSLEEIATRYDELSEAGQLFVCAEIMHELTLCIRWAIHGDVKQHLLAALSSALTSPSLTRAE